MAEQPNILLVSTDQQRFDTCGPCKPGWLRTPHLDQLHHEGIHFSRAYADCPVCVPARMGILSGRYVYSHGMPNNGPSTQVLGREGTLPTRLRELGYQTYAVGKMHFGPQRARHGFDEILLPDDYYTEMGRSGDPLQPMRHGMGQCELEPALSTVPEARTLTAWTAERCVDFIRDRRDPTAPFFLWCSFSKPHPPFDPPEPYFSMYRDAPIPEPVRPAWLDPETCPVDFLRTMQSHGYDRIPPETLRAIRAAYYGLITQIDYNLGRVFGALTETGLWKDTLILFTSDHGEYLGDLAAGGKCWMHEPSAHVPFVLRLPRKDGDMHGTASDALVTHADILPTLVAAAGGTCGEDVDGVDLAALARGEAAPRKHLAMMCGARGELWHNAILDGRWKYAFHHEGGREQLFDLEADPTETVDLAANPAHDAKRRELREALVAFLRERDARTVNSLQDAFGWYLPDEARALDKFLDGDDLRVEPLENDTERDRRADRYAGFMTEYAKVDTRH